MLVMDMVLFDSDLLIHYYTLREGEDPQLHEQAVTVMERIINGQLSAYISDVTVLEFAKYLEQEQLKTEDLVLELHPNPEIEDPKAGRLHPRKERVAAYIEELIVHPYLHMSDEPKWRKVYYYYSTDGLITLEEAYQAATRDYLQEAENQQIRGIVTFDKAYDFHLWNVIPRIDPASFQN